MHKANKHQTKHKVQKKRHLEHHYIGSWWYLQWT